MKFKDKVSVVIAILGAILFGTGCVGCYVWLFMNFSWTNAVGVVIAAAIPGFIAYSIIVAVVQFIREEKPSKKNRK